MDTKDDGVIFPYDLASLSETLKICNLEMVLLKAIGQRSIVDTLEQDQAFFFSAEPDRADKLVRARLHPLHGQL
jgi:hypothetical protein